MTTVRLSPDHLQVRLIGKKPGGDQRWLAHGYGSGDTRDFRLRVELQGGMSATLGDYDWDAGRSYSGGRDFMTSQGGPSAVGQAAAGDAVTSAPDAGPAGTGKQAAS